MLNASHRSSPSPAYVPGAEPFSSAEDVWFWTIAALAARHAGARSGRSSFAVKRPCEPDDVIRCLSGLYRGNRIDIGHARVMQLWGERGRGPSKAAKGEQADHRLWQEAMDQLDGPLRVKGIIGGIGKLS